MSSEPQSKQQRSKQLIVAAAGLLAVSLLFLWREQRSLASAQDAYRTAYVQLGTMRLDAERIAALRDAPKTATARARTNEELLAQVESALAAAKIDRRKWQDSVPEPPVRLPKSDYMKVGTRLYFEGLTLQDLATLAYELKAQDPTLRLSGLSLTNTRHDGPEYDIEVAVSYLLYAPKT